MVPSPPTTATTTIAATLGGGVMSMEDTAMTEEVLSYGLTEETFTPHDVVRLVHTNHLKVTFLFFGSRPGES